MWTKWSSADTCWQKSVCFWSEISDSCAYVCKYFLVGCGAQKGPKGPYLREKSCPTSLRYLVLKKSDFESTKFRILSSPDKLGPDRLRIFKQKHLLRKSFYNWYVPKIFRPCGARQGGMDFLKKNRCKGGQPSQNFSSAALQNCDGYTM